MLPNLLEQMLPGALGWGRGELLASVLGVQGRSGQADRVVGVYPMEILTKRHKNSCLQGYSLQHYLL